MVPTCLLIRDKLLLNRNQGNSWSPPYNANSLSPSILLCCSQVHQALKLICVTFLLSLPESCC